MTPPTTDRSNFAPLSRSLFGTPSVYSGLDPLATKPSEATTPLVSWSCETAHHPLG